jgi:hypothetical protein
MLHNESVNIWSHLLGAMLVITLIVYTTIFIKSHKNELLNVVNLSKVNEEIKSVAKPLLEVLPNLQSIT